MPKGPVLLCLVVVAFAGAPIAQANDDVREAVAMRALTSDGLGADEEGCPSTWPESLRFMLARRFASDADALALATALFDRHGVVVGVERAHDMDGGFRGLLQLVPEWPVGRHARHLTYVLAAHDAIEATLAALRSRAPRPVTYRHRGIVYRFLRSVGRTTPSAYASAWTIGYNVSGSLHRNEQAVRATLTHEIFHLNDQEMGEWSVRTLTPLHARILARCSGARACLAPYAPTSVVVRGGTYYAFQPDNGASVMEYGAEIASRFIDEHMQILARGRLSSRAFKCITPENAEAYALVSSTFFGGVDLTGACARHR